MIGHWLRRCCRAVRLAAEQLNQLDAALSASIPGGVVAFAGLRLTTLCAVPAGSLLGSSCLRLVREAQLGGQDFYRLAAATCALTFGSGQRVLRHSVSASAHAQTARRQLGRQVVALHYLVVSLGETWAGTSRLAIARTVLKPSSVLPWMAAAGSALRHAHDQLNNGGEWLRR